MDVQVQDKRPSQNEDQELPQVQDQMREGANVAEKGREIYEVSLGDRVTVTGSMCSLSTKQAVDADVSVSIQVHVPVVCISKMCQSCVHWFFFYNYIWLHQVYESCFQVPEQVCVRWFQLYRVCT